MYAGMTHTKYLVSDVALPEGTIITFEDLSQNVFKFYSYVVSAQDYIDNKTRYRLDDFVEAGSVDSKFVSGYNYDPETRIMSAEYNFIIDFIATGNNKIPDGQHSFTFEVEINGTVQSSSDVVSYNIYSESTDFAINMATNKESFKEDESVETTVEIIVNPIVVNNITVHDTTLDNLDTSIRYSLYDSTNTVKINLSKGTYVTVDSTRNNLYPDGSLRTSLNVPLQSLNRNFVYQNSLSNYAVGNYNIRLDLIGSYYSVNDSNILATEYFPLSIVEKEKCSILSEITGNTGIVHIANEEQINYQTDFLCTNVTENATLTVKLYKKNIDLFSDFGYSLVDMKDYIKNFNRELYAEKEYVLETVPYNNSKRLTGSFLKTAAFRNDISPGTYKMVFTVINGSVTNSDNLYFYAK